MAIHPDANGLTVEAVEEYLEIAKLCITATKQDGGIYGYPATLLLLCVVDALGRSLLEGRERREPFRVLNQAPFNCGIKVAQIKQLEKWYRNPLAHNGMIAPGVCLSPEDGGTTPFVFVSEEPVLIRVKALYSLVRDSWDQVDKAKLNSSLSESTNPLILNPINFSSASMAVPVTASGSNYVPPQWKKQESGKG